MRIIADEAGPEIAGRIAERAAREMAGARITVCPRREPIDAQAAEAIAPGRPRVAADALGVAPSTIYRALRRPIVR